METAMPQIIKKEKNALNSINGNTKKSDHSNSCGSLLNFRGYTNLPYIIKLKTLTIFVNINAKKM